MTRKARASVLLIFWLCTLLFSVCSAQDDAFPAVLELYVNHVKKGSLFLMLTDNNDVLVDVDDFKVMGVKIEGGKSRVVNGKTYMILSTMAPGITYTVDQGVGSLNLMVRPDLLGKTTVVDFQTAKPPGVAFKKASSFFLIIRSAART